MKTANKNPRIPRIQPLSPPYEKEAEESLRKWMPPGAALEPLNIFRTLQRNAPMADRLRGLGSYILGRKSLLDIRHRELLILRTCALCGAEYEWGVHAAAFRAQAGLGEKDIAATVSEARVHIANTSEPSNDSLVLCIAEELHGSATISDELWDRLKQSWSDEQIMEMMLVCGFYHFISFFVNSARLELEPWQARFDQYGGEAIAAPETSAP